MEQRSCEPVCAGSASGEPELEEARHTGTWDGIAGVETNVELCSCSYLGPQNLNRKSASNWKQ